ncbi:CCD42 protein, partial [Geococcyx californianus]|nr:CCD42 protein [Geococcyx californianus]
EKDSLPSCIRLQNQKKEVQLMQKALDEKREAFKERMEVIASRWKDLQAKEAKLKAYMEESERTLKKNEIMRLSALNRAREEREKTMKKESELFRAKVEAETVKIQHQKLSTKLQKYSIFKKYLEGVVKVSQFKDIEEVMVYYKVLMRMRKDLLESQKRLKEMSEQVQMLLDKHVAEKEVKIQQYKTKLKQLQLHLDQAQKDIPQDEVRKRGV